ncbi:MAG TPA: hypothetical protein VFC01_33375 [Mycobacterium sp.]|nr:hypothetical protein [Mycobacterium sp.]
MGEFVTGEAARERFRALAEQVEAAYAEMRSACCPRVCRSPIAMTFVGRMMGPRWPC